MRNREPLFIENAKNLNDRGVSVYRRDIIVCRIFFCIYLYFVVIRDSNNSVTTISIAVWDAIVHEVCPTKGRILYSFQRPDGLVGTLRAARPPGQMLGGHGTVVVPSRRAQVGVPFDGRQRRSRVPRVPETGQAGRRARAIGQRAPAPYTRVRLPAARRTASAVATGTAAAFAMLQERRRHRRVLRGSRQNGRRRPVRSGPVPVRSRTTRHARARILRGRHTGRR